MMCAAADARWTRLRRPRHVSWGPCRPGPRSTSPSCRAAARRCACTTRPPARSAPPHPRPRPSCTSAAITPYDATHLGHAATYLAFDLVNRYWHDLGHDVAYVQNITDIDDPLLERAARDQDDWVVLGMRETAQTRVARRGAVRARPASQCSVGFDAIAAPEPRFVEMASARP